MAKLSGEERETLPKTDFALPEQRRFPVEDAAHARNAKARAAQAAEKGTLSQRDRRRVDAKADAVLRRD